MGSKKDKVVKGNKEFLIGEYFEYDETNGGTITDINDVKWKVLGADADGNLLIVSDRSVSLLEFGDKYNLENAKKDYIEGVTTLNEIASLYGMGNGAIDARSITVEDVDRVLGYVHNEPSDMSDYGSVVTYYELDDEYPRYEASTGEIGRLSILHNNFFWYDFDKKNMV